jgi:PKD repeat protein
MGIMKLKNLFVITIIVSSLLCITAYSIEAVDVTIADETGDVYSQDQVTQEWSVITYSPYINVDNLDLVQATYTKTGTQATVSLQVKGNIENREYSSGYYNEEVNYDLILSTSDHGYFVHYCNRTGYFYNGDKFIDLTASDFSVVNDTLTITFPLQSADEIYENLNVESTYYQWNYNNSFVCLEDVAPNPPLYVSAFTQCSIGYVGENIQFNGYVEALSGHPPYTYYWDFGDGNTSTQLNPIHTYTKVGDYTYTLTVTDKAGATKNDSGTISIKTLKKVFLFGSFSYIYTNGDYFQVGVANLRMITFKPFQVSHYVNGQNIMFLQEYKGIMISNHFLIGMFNVLID